MKPISTPPNWILKVLNWFCPDQLLEEIEGDLFQKFQKDVEQLGLKKAKRKFIWNSIRYFRPEILLRNKNSFELNQTIMIRSYLVVMLRNIRKKKFYAGINILGLSIGITFAMLMGTFIQEELNVNQELKDVEQLYILESEFTDDNNGFKWLTPTRLVKQSVEEYPTIFENYYRFWDRSITISKGTEHERLQSMIGDPSLISIFGFNVLHGNGKTALESPNSIVITDKIANLYFHKTNVLGETLSVSTERMGVKEYVITAVIKEPQNKNSVSDFMNMDAQVFLSLENIKDFYAQSDLDSWSTDIISYIRLSPFISANEAESTINNLFKENAPAAISDQKNILLRPIADFYLDINNGAVKKLIRSISVVALLILFLAISNFINISIASSFSRLKEVGVRKVIGGLRVQVFTQFLTESLVLSFFASLLSLVLYQLLYLRFGEILNTELPSILNFKNTFWVWFALGIPVIGFLAGIYPAIYQSTIKIIDAIKGKFKSVKTTVQFSRSLITVQFLIAISIFITALVMSLQVSYFLEKDLGYNKEHVLIINSVPRVWNESGFQKIETVKQEFLQSSKILSASISWGAPGKGISPNSQKVYTHGTPVNGGLQTSIGSVDSDYLNVYKLKIKSGSFFSDKRTTHNSNEVVINDLMQKLLQVQVGDNIKIEGFKDKEFTIIGVVNDFNFESLREPVQPLALMSNWDFEAYRYLSLRLQPGSVKESLEEVEKLWKNNFPDEPFNYSFADELGDLYKTEFQLKKASSIATFLMIAIVLTGILGLVSLSVAKRTKEIGIRKVLGATVSNIILLVAKEYVIVITIATVLAVPFAYFIANNWLGNYAYSISLQGWMFAVPTFSLFIVTIAIVSLQSLGTALINPVKSLRYE
ncbi:MAG: ABC transporter permease [Cyclobacteriaceae bacterium]